MKTTILFILTFFMTQTAFAANSQFAIYYAWPSVINHQKNKGDINKIFADLKEFEGVVFADGLQNVDHPDHQFSKDLFRMLTDSGVKVFGYIGVGINTMWNDRQIENSLQKWMQMSVTGLLLDEAGYDFHLPGENQSKHRSRINSVVKTIHRNHLSVVMNAHNPMDLFGDNLKRLHDSELTPSDYYLYESYLFSWSPTSYEYEFHMEKISTLRAAKEKYGVKIIGMATTAVELSTVPQPEIDFLYIASFLENVDSIGMAPFNYSTMGENTGKIRKLHPTYEIEDTTIPMVYSKKSRREERQKCVEFEREAFIVDYVTRKLSQVSDCRRF